VSVLLLLCQDCPPIIVIYFVIVDLYAAVLCVVLMASLMKQAQL